jgi:hypothetical protein
MRSDSSTLAGEASLAPASSVPSQTIEGMLGSGGHTLDQGTRAFFEPRFGHDFSRVRVHTDEAAAESARSIGARAYTDGTHIVFSEGRYAPASSAGKFCSRTNLRTYRSARCRETGDLDGLRISLGSQAFIFCSRGNLERAWSFTRKKKVSASALGIKKDCGIPCRQALILRAPRRLVIWQDCNRVALQVAVLSGLPTSAASLFSQCPISGLSPFLMARRRRPRHIPLAREDSLRLLEEGCW